MAAAWGIEERKKSKSMFPLFLQLRKKRKLQCRLLGLYYCSVIKSLICLCGHDGRPRWVVCAEVLKRTEGKANPGGGGFFFSFSRRGDLQFFGLENRLKLKKMCFQQEGGRWGRKRQMVKGRSTHSKNNCYSFSLSLSFIFSR